ncbi:hypothetical protein Tco_0637360, partial [Tanacetum coccineum]
LGKKQNCDEKDVDEIEVEDGVEVGGKELVMSSAGGDGGRREGSNGEGGLNCGS